MHGQPHIRFRNTCVLSDKLQVYVNLYLITGLDRLFTAPGSLDSHMNVGILPALRTGRLYTQEFLPVLISVTGGVDSRATVRMERLGQ